MRRLKPNLWLILAFVGGLIYPLLVYAGANKLPPSFLILAGLALIGLRLFGLRKNSDIKLWGVVFAIAAIALIICLVAYPHLAPQAYPVIVSLSVACIFGLSLLLPPTIVERIARISEPDLPPEGIIYTRRVTMVWTVFLVLNAIIAAALALWGTLSQWTLWTGLISYLLMGTLFAVEFLIRRRVRR